jgi:hypothetical protein
MTTAAPDTERPTDTARCGCCGEESPMAQAGIGAASANLEELRLGELLNPALGIAKSWLSSLDVRPLGFRRCNAQASRIQKRLLSATEGSCQATCGGGLLRRHDHPLREDCLTLLVDACFN